MKTKLIYNLGRRGFFSEINNMILAKIYANKYHFDFIVNSYYWNCRYKNGLHDYFENEIQEQNNLFSAQITRNRFRFTYKINNLHTLFYNINYIRNVAYLIFHRNVLLGSEIYNEMRSDIFLKNVDPDDFIKEIQKCLRIKPSIRHEFDLIFNHLKIGGPFLGVHIRRGDKITTGEMNDISLDRYAEEIIATSYKSIYLATDDIMCVNYLKEKMELKGIHVYYNPSLSRKGFSEGLFNHTSRRKRYEETLILLLDIYVLSKASFFIGTYSSNLSRVIPCLLGFNNCKSLDTNWHIG